MSVKYFRYVRKVNNCNFSSAGVKYYTHSAVEVVSNNVNYPRILDATPEGKLRNERQKFYDHVLSLPTAEEKLLAITSWNYKPRVKVFRMSAAALTCNGVPFQQYVTRSHLIHGLPQKYQETNVDETLNFLQPHLFRVIAQNLSDRWKTGFKFGQKATYELVSQIYRILSLKHDFLLHSAFDRNPRISAFWWHGDFASEKNKLDEKNICFQYEGLANFAVRIKAPLAPIVPLNDPLCASPDVPNFNYHPACFGIPFQTRKYITSVPGFWPGEHYEYPLVSFHSKKNITLLRAKVDHIGALTFPTIEDGFGIMSSFGWLLSIAMNLGFSPFHDVTYPLVTQKVLTDGQDWHFFVYQLNTMCFHSDVDSKNKRNICWSSGKMRLFETIENGELKGVNYEVFKILLKFFLNSPQIPSGIELKPYLSTCTKSAEEFREIKELLLKMYSNRPDRRAHTYEVPLWQHIYKWHRDAPPSLRLKLK